MKKCFSFVLISVFLLSIIFSAPVHAQENSNGSENQEWYVNRFLDSFYRNYLCTLSASDNLMHYEVECCYTN